MLAGRLSIPESQQDRSVGQEQQLTSDARDGLQNGTGDEHHHRIDEQGAKPNPEPSEADSVLRGRNERPTLAVGVIQLGRSVGQPNA